MSEIKYISLGNGKPPVPHIYRNGHWLPVNAEHNSVEEEPVKLDPVINPNPLNSILISLRISPIISSQLQEISSRKNITTSEVIRKAITFYYESKPWNSV